MRAELDRQREPIAIVGMACRFPGGANDLGGYWSMLDEGRDAMRPVPTERWDAASLFHAHPDPHSFWQSYMRSGNFLDHPIDGFDADFFRISPREAAAMDPQQRLLLEVAWEALEHAGVPPTSLRESSTGVYIGLITGDYGRVPFEEVVTADLPYFGTGNAISFPAGRLSYFLGLQGPCMVVATACSSTLVSTHLAMQSLRRGECDLALSGGVSLMIYPDTSTVLSHMGVLARDGRSKTFDAAADGFGRGEGCGVLVLKRLSDAQRDGDRIHALLRGSAVNHDGPSGGLTVPHGPAQQRLLASALASAELGPADVDYIEAHGTGTPLGDPIEVQAIDAVMRSRPADRPLWLGSVKTNIGHLEAAAGVAGIIKLALALEHETLPANLHLRTLNPAIDWARCCARVVVEQRPWPRGERPRVAGVSSFGLSGINGHVLVSEAPSPSFVREGSRRAIQILPLSAKSPAALAELARRWSAALEHASDESFGDLCHTARVARSHVPGQFAWRAAPIGADVEQLRARMNELAELAGLAGPAESPRSRTRKLALLFTGQGSQYVDMGRELFEREPSFRAAIEQCAALLDPRLERPLLSVLYPSSPPADSPIDQTRWAHVTLFALEYALARCLFGWGVTPAYLFGHSLGEYVAACLAGVFELDEALRIVEARGRLMQALASGGAMVAVRAGVDRVAPLVEMFADRVAIAADNGPANVTISGEANAIAGIVAQLERRAIHCRPLRVSHAFHSPAMDPMLDEFEAVVAGATLRRPTIPVVSSLLGRASDDALLDPRYWRRQIRETVAFAEGLRWLDGQGVDAFLELGPSPVLTGLARATIERDSTQWLSVLGSRPDHEGLASTCAALHVAGQAIDWSAYDAEPGARRHRRVAAPTYPWQRRRFWIETPRDYFDRRRQAGERAGDHPLLGRPLELATSTRVFESRLAASSPAWLAEHQVFGVVVLPGAALLEMFLAAARSLLEGDPALLEQVEFLRALVLPEARSLSAQLVAEREGEAWSLSVHTRASASEPWVARARARLRRASERDEPESSPIARGPAPDDVARAERFYAHAGALGLTYGPAFRVVRALAGSGQRCTGLVEQQVDLDSRSPWCLHPSVGDGCLQVLGAIFPEQLGHELDDAVHLPVAIDRVRVHRAAPARLQIEARMRGGEGRAGERRADFTIYAIHGEGEGEGEGDDDPIVEVEGVRFRAASNAALRAELTPQRDDCWYAERWIERPAIRLAAPASDSRWLLVGDDPELAERLAQALRARAGGAAITITIAGAERDALDRLHDPTALTGVVDLRALALSGELHRPAHEPCMQLLALIRAVLAHPSAPLIACVSTGAVELGLADAGPSRPLAATLHGLLRVASREHRELRAVAIDLSTPTLEFDALADELLARAGSPNAEVRVVLHAGGRRVARLGRTRIDPKPLALAGHATYLVTGGARGIGAQILVPLADAGARSLVVVGRSGEFDDEARVIVDALRQRGVRIEARALDVSDPIALARLIAWIDAELGPLCGVVHSAALIDDGTIATLSEAQFEAAFAAKLIGAHNLDRATRDRELDFFVLFSSAAAALASAGQANYVAANAYLDALADERRRAGLPATAIAWAAWDRVGAAARAGVIDRLARRGMQAISPERGQAWFAQILAAAPSRVIVAPVDWQAMSEAQGDPFFEDLVRPVAALAATGQSGLLERLRSATGKRRRALIDERVAALTAGVLARPAHELGVEQPFFDLGMDSLMAVELRDALQREFGFAMPATLAVEQGTLAALGRWIESNHPALREPGPREPALREPAVSEAQPLTLRSEAARDEAERLIDAAETLSDAEIRARLRGRARA
ncbi:type I polyketide synthase [Nannocystaceae bacterium ST9]